MTHSNTSRHSRLGMGWPRRCASLKQWVRTALLGLGVALTPLASQAQRMDAGTPRTDTMRLTLDAAVQYAIESNPAMLAARTGESIATYQAQERWSGLLPKVSGTAQYNRHLKKPVIFLPEGSPLGSVLEVGSDNSYQAGLSATMPLVALPLYHGVKLGLVEYHIARTQTRSTRITLTGEVRLAFAGLLLAKQSLEVTEQSMHSAEQTLRNVQNMARHGMSSEYELIRARVQVGNLRPTHLQAQQAVASAELRLKSLLSLDESQPIALEGTLESIAARYTPGDEPKGDLPPTNPAIQLLDLQGERMQRQYRMARDAHWPTLAAFANFQLQSQANNFEFSNYQWVKTSVVGLQLNVPIFEGFSTHLKAQQARAGMQRLAYERENTARQLALGLRVQWQQMQRSHAAMESGREAIELARKGVEIARTRYQSGAGTLLELTDAEMALMQASLNYYQAVYNYVQAYIEYAKTRGNE